MTLSEFLNEFAIKTSLQARTKTEAIEELIDLLVDEHEISMTDRVVVFEAVQEREKMISTGMEHGLAIPHGATEVVDDIVAALGISKSGIEFQSLDGKPTYIVLLLILPISKYSSGVQALAGIARLLNSSSLRERILGVSSAGEIMDVIVEEEERQFLAGNTRLH